MSDSPRLHRIAKLVRKALTHPPKERAAFLAEACPTPQDRKLAAACLDRMAAGSEEETALAATRTTLRAEEDAEKEPNTDNEPAKPSHDVADAPTRTAPSGPFDMDGTALASELGMFGERASPSNRSTKHVGPWRLKHLLGRGGMGAVYLAERDDGHFQQRAALKLIRHDLGPSAQQRFLSERQILAQLQHPNIAHLLDGGVTDDGRLYFAMEYVDGTPLDTYCNANNLGVEARLQLFQQVCEAVQFAHRNLIVHRDLKPANILVMDAGASATSETSSTSRGGPQVKLLDFGIAKALEGAEAVESHTRTGEGGPMTPAYAAPEQVEGQAITTATDVYALGLVLCELLTGALPYDVRGRPALEAARVIIEDAPEPLHTLVDESTSESVLAACGISAEALRTRLRGDLAMIVQKAVRKEPERRYTSAADIDQEIHRHLNGLPVEARPASTSYRLRRFVARNRPAVFGAMGAVVALIIGLGLAVWQGQVAASERDRAQRQANRAEAVQTFLVDMIGRAAPAVTGGEALTVREVLDEADAELAAPTLQEQPEVSMNVRMTISQMYRLLGEGDGAVQQGRAAYETGRAHFGPTHPMTLHAAGVYGHSLLRSGQIAQADSLYRTVVPNLDGVDTTPDVRFSLLAKYGEVLRYRSRLDSAEVFLRRSLDEYDRMETPDTLSLTTAISALGGVYRRQGRVEEAETQYRKALAISEERASEDRKPAVAILTNNLANLHRQQGELEDAERMFRRALRLSTELFGESSGNVAAMMANLSAVLQSRGKTAEADRMSQRAVDLHRELFPPTDYRIGFALGTRIQVLMEQERFALARTAGEEALGLFQNNLGSEHPRTVEMHRTLAGVNRALGRLDAAATHGAAALAAYRTTRDSTDAILAETRVQLGRIRIEQERYNDAARLLTSARRVAQRDSSMTDVYRQAREQLELLYEAQGDAEAAR